MQTTKRSHLHNANMHAPKKRIVNHHLSTDN